MFEIDDITSVEVQTDEDEISGNFCGDCHHLIKEEHYVGTLTSLTKCFGLIFNGTVWESCKCTRIVPFPFIIKVMVPDYANNSPN